MSRAITSFKLRAIPFLKTLDANFFARLIIFGGLIYYISKF